MKRWGKSILAAALCAVLLLAGIIIPALGSSSSVFLMAVNDQVMEMTTENMPMLVNGTLYVPYTMLSSRSSGANLGVTALYSMMRRTVLVSSGQRSVTFDTRSNTAADSQGNPLNVWAVVRNNMVFLPVDWLCDYFDAISYSLSRTPYGTLVRITNNDAILTDAEFVDMAMGWLAKNLEQYQKSIAPSATPTPSAAPAPSTPPAGQSTPPQTSAPPQISAPPVQASREPVPSASPSQEPDEEGAQLYLAIRWGDQGLQAAQMLEERSLRALFLFTPEELRTCDNQVRRLAATGHGIGLIVSGNGPDSLAQAEEGRRLLAAAARCDTVVVCAAGLDWEARDLLIQSGYVLWNASLLGKNYTTGERLVRRLSVRQVNRVELDAASEEMALFRSALTAMENANCRIELPTAPALDNPAIL